MPQDNTQSFLRINPVQPGQAPDQAPLDFKTAELHGGQTRVGQASQQIGPTSEQAQFGALAQIAGGAQKAIGTFAEIGGMVEDKKIKQAKTYFGKINSRDDLTPDQKQQEYDKYMQTVWTPLSGTGWKDDMANEMDRNWTSKRARNDYEEQRYISDYATWKSSPKNKGRPETPELMQEFHAQYEAMYPSAKRNDWYKLTFAKTNSAISEKQAKKTLELTSNSIRTEWDIPSPDEYKAYKSSRNKVEQGIFETRFKRFNDVLLQFPHDDPEAAYTHVHNLLSAAMDPAISGFREDAAMLVKDEIDTIAYEMTKEIFALTSSQRSSDLQDQAATDLASSKMAYGRKRNTAEFLQSFTWEVANLQGPARDSEVMGLVPTMWSMLQSGSSPEAIKFQALSLDDQIKFVESEFQAWYKDPFLGVVNQALFEQGTGIKPDTFDEFMSNGTFAIRVNENMGGKIVNENIKGLDSLSKDIIAVMPLNSPQGVQQGASKFKRDVATLVGLGEEDIDNMFYETKKADPTVKDSKDAKFPRPFQTAKEWYDKLPSEKQKILADRGFTSGNFKRLEELKAQVVAVEKAALVARSGQGSGNEDNALKSFEGLSLEARRHELIMNPELRHSAIAAIKLFNSDENHGGLDGKTLEMASQMNSLMAVDQAEFDGFLATKREGESAITPGQPSRYPEKLDLYGVTPNAKGETVPFRISPTEISKTFVVNPDGSLPPESRDNLLRLEFLALQIARGRIKDEATAKFTGEMDTLLARVAKNPQVAMATNPQEIYVLAATISGLAAGDPSFSSVQYAIGEDAAESRAMYSILSAAGSNSGGLLFMEGDTTEDGRFPRALNTFVQMMDILAGRTIQGGVGTVSPLHNTSDFATQVSAQTEIDNYVEGYSKAGASAARTNITGATLASRFFPSMRKDSEVLATELADTLWRAGGMSLPRPGDSDTEVSVGLPTDSGIVQTEWEDLTSDQQIGLYIATLNQHNPIAFKEFLGGWLQHVSDNPNDESWDLERFGSLWGILDKSQRRGMATSMDGVKTNPTVMMPKITYGVSGEVNVNTESVQDGRKISRLNLLREAEKRRGSTLTLLGNVDQKPSYHWAQTPQYGSIYMNGKHHPMQIGGGQSPTDYTLTTFCSEPLSPDRRGYKKYEWMAKTLGIPDEEQMSLQGFQEAIRRGLPPDTAPNLVSNYHQEELRARFENSGLNLPNDGEEFANARLRAQGRDAGEFVYPPLFEIFNEHHGIDLAQPNLDLTVSQAGEMIFHVGRDKYTLQENPPQDLIQEFYSAQKLNFYRASADNAARRFIVERARKRLTNKLKAGT